MADKKRTEPDWQDLRIFLALGRLGTLSAAARALSVNHATISRRVRSLEITLGEKLVDRRPEGYALTAAGTRTLAVASDMETALQTLGRGGADGLPRGLVRVNAPPGLSQGFLIRRLSELPIQYPGLDIDLATDLRSVSLERHETDIAIRFGRPQDGDIVAKQVATIAYGFYGIASVCDAVKGGAEPVFVGFDEINAHVPEAVWLAQHHLNARVAFRANNQVLQAAAARVGAGLALLPHYIGRSTPDLQLCSLGEVPSSREVWLLTRRSDRKYMPISTVVEFLARVFAQERGLFEVWEGSTE